MPFRNTIRALIFITIGAISIVFADMFVLPHHREPNPSWWSNNVFTTLYSRGKDRNTIDFAVLKSRNAQYLVDGIAMPMEEGIKATQHYVFSPDKALDQIEPAAGTPQKDININMSGGDPSVGLGALGLEELDIAAIYARGDVENVILALGELPEPKIKERRKTFPPKAEAKKEKSKKKSEKKSKKTSEEDSYEAYTHASVEVQEDNDIFPNMPDETYKRDEYHYIAPDIPSNAGGKIAIIIDDMGLSLRSKQIEVMPDGLTLSYLPYAKKLEEHAKRALANGHEVMLHMPMEPLDSRFDAGSHSLKVSQSPQELRQNLNWGLSQFKGYTGVNNHMGSRLTMNKEAMDVVMGELKKRGMFFVDSRTINSSVAAKSARAVGIPYAVRDIFLDHKVDPSFIRIALKKLEYRAKRKGYAIAIGHPHKETVRELKKWLPTLEAKGITLVPVSELLMRPVLKNLQARALKQ